MGEAQEPVPEQPPEVPVVQSRRRPSGAVGQFGLGAPAYLRLENGPELIAYAVADLCRFNSAASVVLEPWLPLAERGGGSLNGRLRGEFFRWKAQVSVVKGQCDDHARALSYLP